MATDPRLTPRERLKTYRDLGMHPALTDYPFDVRKRGFHTEKKTPGNMTKRSMPIHHSATNRQAPNVLSERDFQRMVHNVTIPIRHLLHNDTPQNRKILKEGLEWYPSANEELVRAGKRYGGGIDRAAGVAAALSPKMPWDKNLPLAIEALRTRDASVAIGAYPKNQAKAQRIIEGEDPAIVLSKAGSGGKHLLKIGNFYHNLRDPENPDFITIDSHAARAALGFVPTAFGTEDDIEHVQEITIDEVGAYNTYKNAYRRAFDRISGAGGIKVPSQLQAVNWTFWRDLKHNLPRASSGEFYD